MPSSKESSGSKLEERHPEQAPLESLTVSELKVRLKERGLPQYGRKKELIERLTNPPTGPKPKAWQCSDAKKTLKSALLDPNSPVNKMSVGEIQNMDERYKRYPNFEKYYKDLKKKVEGEKQQVEIDDLAARMHLMSFPTPAITAKGYPSWKGHPAKALLEVDVANKLNQTLKPEKLQATRAEYQEFPLCVFRKRVNREADKQRTTAYWADKRNKKALKKYLKALRERAAEQA